jgi:5-methylcytosine-specific restriction endonuclease McrA
MPPVPQQAARCKRGRRRLREIQRASYYRYRESRIAAVNAYRHGSLAGAGSVGKRLRWIAESTDGTLTKDTIKALFAAAKDCAYCAAPIKGKSKTLDHLEPVSRGGGHTAANVLICCKPCNSAKGSMAFADWLGRLAARHGEAAAKRATKVFKRVTGRDPRQAPMSLLFCVAGSDAKAAHPTA